jgi:hypothetical protein
LRQIASNCEELLDFRALRGRVPRNVLANVGFEEEKIGATFPDGLSLSTTDG